MRSDLRELADTINHWSQKYPFFECIYVFGSRVRGDHNEESDVDLSIDLDSSDENLADWADWQCQTREGTKLNPVFDALQEALQGKRLHLIGPDDSPHSDIRKVDARLVYQTGKVKCILTPPKTIENVLPESGD